MRMSVKSFWGQKKSCVCVCGYVCVCLPEQWAMVTRQVLYPCCPGSWLLSFTGRAGRTSQQPKQSEHGSSQGQGKLFKVAQSHFLTEPEASYAAPQQQGTLLWRGQVLLITHSGPTSILLQRWFSSRLPSLTAPALNNLPALYSHSPPSLGLQPLLSP